MQWQELQEHACLMGDELFFDVILEISKKISNKCLLNACKSRSSNIMTKLFNMKAQPTKECISMLSYIDTESYYSTKNVEICELLINNGLPITLETIDLLLEIGYTVPNLKSYDIPYDINIYKICHKHKEMSSDYIDNLEVSVNNDLRKSLRIIDEIDDTVCNNIINKIKSGEIIPDYMMYDDIVEYKHTTLIEYFEKNLFKPNFETLLRIEDFRYRRSYAKKNRITQ